MVELLYDYGRGVVVSCGGWARDCRRHGKLTRLCYTETAMGDYVPQIPQWFDVRKAAHVAAFFALRASGHINIVKLMKLMYLADRESISQRDMPITGDDFASMKLGPILENTYDLAKGAAHREEWAEFIAPREGHDLSLARPVDLELLDELSRSEVSILEAIWAKFKDMDQWELAEWAHEFCPEWRDPGNSSIRIAYASIGNRLGKPDPFGLAEQVDEDRRLASTLFVH